MQQPSFLQTRDGICVVATANLVTADEIQALAKKIISRGFEPLIGPHILAGDGRFSGTDAERQADLQRALNHTTAKAILCARGGYGTTRIIDEVSWDLFEKNPKRVIGFSDVTALLSQVNNLGIEGIHGPMGCHLIDPQRDPSGQILLETLTGNLPGYSLPSHTFNRPGQVTAPLVWGNLTLLCSSIGTGSEGDFEDKILFVEDINEAYYAVDRMLVQLYRAGKLKHIKGLVAGERSNMKPGNPPLAASMQEVIRRHADILGVPLLLDFPAGHEMRNMSLVMGHSYTLTIGADKSSLIPEKGSDKVISL